MYDAGDCYYWHLGRGYVCWQRSSIFSELCVAVYTNFKSVEEVVDKVHGEIAHAGTSK